MSIVTYKSPRWRARKKRAIRVDEDFLPAMARADALAEEHDLTVFVTQSLRDPKASLSGTVVRPAIMSNHLVGHGIDFNLIDADGTWYNSRRLARMRYLPDHVQAFIQGLRDDPVLRWGGDFRTPDVIHFDDRLNKLNPEEWIEKFNTLWGSE